MLDYFLKKGGNFGGVKGEELYWAKLNPEKVRRIRNIYRNILKHQKLIGEFFGVKQSTIGSILLGKTWKHVV